LLCSCCPSLTTESTPFGAIPQAILRTMFAYYPKNQA
jgi:hypothetical protein